MSRPQNSTMARIHMAHVELKTIAYAMTAKTPTLKSAIAAVHNADNADRITEQLFFFCCCVFGFGCSCLLSVWTLTKLGRESIVDCLAKATGVRRNDQS